MRKITTILLVGSLAILFSGCGKQPDVNKYVNPKITNENIKQQKFKDDSLRCELYAHNSISQPNRTSNYVYGGNDSGSFDMTNVATGQQYSGTYSSNGGGFSKGLANGSAVGGAWANSIKTNNMREKAWKYCMLSAGWREKQ